MATRHAGRGKGQFATLALSTWNPLLFKHILSIFFIMSWQDYVDKQLLASGFVNHAAIIGTDGSLWAKSAAFNVIIWQFFKFNSRVSFYFLWHSYCLLNLSCVPNWLWGGAVCRAMLTTRHCSRHIWARSWPNFYLACHFLFSLPTCHLENWNFNRQFDDEFLNTRTTWHAFLPMHVLKCVTLRAWVSVCVWISTVSWEHRRLCGWRCITCHPIPEPFWLLPCMWSGILSETYMPCDIMLIIIFLFR